MTVAQPARSVNNAYDPMERINTRTRPTASASAPATVPPTALITRPTVPSSPACVVESANLAVTAGRTKLTVIWL
jgi:hypothetical protein